MGALPMPVTLVPKLQIRSMGSLRLNDVLTEQTGLVVVPQVNGQGNGIQLQGFNPDYTLILIDGEPIIGRYTGSLELSRITVGNIKQIEIVKALRPVCTDRMRWLVSSTLSPIGPQLHGERTIHAMAPITPWTCQAILVPPSANWVSMFLAIVTARQGMTFPLRILAKRFLPSGIIPATSNSPTK